MQDGNLSAVRTFRWEPFAGRLFYAANLGKFLIRRRTVRVFALAAVCLAIYLGWHAALFLRFAAVLGMLTLRIFSATRYRDPTTSVNAYVARKEAKLNAITEARLRKEPWRRPRAPLSVAEEHVGRYLGNYHERRQHVMAQTTYQPARIRAGGIPARLDFHHQLTDDVPLEIQ